jgi:ketosteroid isomerase-like protein
MNTFRFPSKILALSLAFAEPGAPLLAAENSGKDLVAAEDAYTRAIISRDLDALARCLSDELVYLHASGETQDKRQYLRGTEADGFRVIGARIVERNARQYGSIGITMGIIGYDVGKGENFARYMAVYRKEHGKWLLLRWQNAKPTKPIQANK